jgi:DNA-binding MarR family transcriptional regulator
MPSELDFGILLGLSFEAFVHRLHEELARRGFDDVKGSYGYVFRALAERPLSVAELAERLGITSQGVVKLANEMEAAGYVVRESDESDARVTRLALGDRGKRALAAARRFHQAFERELARSEGEKNARTLRAILTRLVESTPGEPPSKRPLRPF